MAYANLTEAQATAIVNAVNVPFLGIEQDALLRLADVLLGLVASTPAVTNINSWAAATATKLNAQFAVANAETTLPFSPALAVDYDTNPQA